MEGLAIEMEPLIPVPVQMNIQGRIVKVCIYTSFMGFLGNHFSRKVMMSSCAIRNVVNPDNISRVKHELQLLYK